MITHRRCLVEALVTSAMVTRGMVTSAMVTSAMVTSAMAHGDDPKKKYFPIPSAIPGQKKTKKGNFLKQNEKT